MDLTEDVSVEVQLSSGSDNILICLNLCTLDISKICMPEKYNIMRKGEDEREFDYRSRTDLD